MSHKKTDRFLAGGGEMGELIRSFDWSKTSVGTPDEWPQTLLNLVGLMLHSAFPMFLFWGKDLTCFYNDAYRPSLGHNGKHPAIGKQAEEVWPDIWHFIGPLIEKVIRTGEPVWFEDQYLPIFRNGRMEDVYWTFSYSPAYGETGEVNGVFVTCTETTEKFLNLKQLQENKDELAFAIEAAELATWDFDPINNTFTANERYAEWFGLPALEETDNDLALKIIAEEDRERVVAAYMKALDYSSGSNYDIEFTIRPHNKPERVLRAKGKAYFNEEKIAYRFNGTLQDVTAESRAKKELAENKQSLELAMEIGELGFFKVDLFTRTANYSHRILEWFGLTKEELSLKEIFRKIHPDDVKFITEAIEASIQGRLNGKHNLTYRLPGKDGITRYLHSIGQVQIVDNTPVAIHGIIEDVTDQILSRRSLEESEHRYRTLIEEATVATGLYIGPDFRIQYVNDIMLGYWGKDSSVLGKSFMEAVPELEGQPFFGLLRKVYTTGERYDGIEEKADLSKDGKLQSFYFNFTYKALRNKEGDIYGIHHMAIDVTERVLAQKALKENELKFRTLVMEAPLPIAVFRGPTYKVELANEHYLKLIGRKKEEFLDRPLFEAIPEIRDMLEPVAKALMETGEPVKMNEFEVMLVRNGNNEIGYYNSAWEPLYEADGSISGFMIMAVEVTYQVLARQKIEEIVAQRTRELADVNKALQENNEELEQFAYVASHDLQEPLRKVRTFTGLLKSSLGEIDERSQTFLNKISESSARMSQLIGDVLNFSQLSKRRQSFVSVDLNSVLDTIIQDFELLIQEKEAQVIYSNLPVIEAVPLHMEQLFSNLISNGLKFSRKEAKPVIRISASTLSPEEEKDHEGLVTGVPHCKITVEDNGIGFKQQYAGQIFDIFQRLHSRFEYEGTGIGLALCKKIMQMHNGFIHATSTEGAGAMFTLIFPIRQR